MKKQTIPEIHRMMVLSTAHITSRTNKMLFTDLINDAGDDIAVDAYEHGWHIVLMNEMSDASYLTPSLKACVRYARSHNCTHLRIDQDGPVLNHLPAYNW